MPAHKVHHITLCASYAASRGKLNAICGGSHVSINVLGELQILEATPSAQCNACVTMALVCCP